MKFLAISLLDPVRAFEDYATLDHLSGGRLELMIGKGNGTAQAEPFSVTADDQWERNKQGYELFRRLWREDEVTWERDFRPPLKEAEALPRPLQRPVRIWHGSATSRQSVEPAARYGHEVTHIQAEPDGLPPAAHRASLELLQGEIAPVLREEIPSRPFPQIGDAT